MDQAKMFTFLWGELVRLQLEVGQLKGESAEAIADRVERLLRGSMELFPDIPEAQMRKMIADGFKKAQGD